MKPRNKPEPHGTEFEIMIPELEEAASVYVPKYRVWTEREGAIVRKYYKKVPIEKLASVLNRTPTSVQEYVGRNGIGKVQA